MIYKVSLKNAAIKSLQKISNPYYENVKSAIYGLAENPRPFGYIKLKGDDKYRIRVGDYRVIYKIMDDTLIVIIVAIGHRKDIYD